MNNINKKLNINKIITVATVLIFVFTFTYTVFATTPDPGHSWTGIGDGTFIVTGPSVMRTYTFPDADASVLTSNALVSVAQGGTGISGIAQGDILYGSAVDTLSALGKDTNATRYLSNTGTSNNPAWAQIDLTNGVTGILPIANGGTNNAYVSFSGPTTSTKTFTLPDASATILTDSALVTLGQGGTGANLTASNGGIFYFNNNDISILSGTATAGQILQGGGSGPPSWSTATYPATAGSAGQILRSDGTNFVTSTATYPDTAGTSGYALFSDGTNFSSTFLPTQFLYVTQGLQATNLTAVTAMASGTTYFQYFGVAPRAYSACTTLFNVTTKAATITWAEVAIFKGPPVINGNASLTLLGYTDVSGTFNSTGRITTSVTLSGVSPGDNLWVAFGSTASTPFQVRGMLADDIQSGVFQTASVRPSLAASPQSTTIAGATAVPARLALRCI